MGTISFIIEHYRYRITFYRLHFFTAYNPSCFVHINIFNDRKVIFLYCNFKPLVLISWPPTGNSVMWVCANTVNSGFSLYLKLLHIDGRSFYHVFLGIWHCKFRRYSFFISSKFNCSLPVKGYFLLLFTFTSAVYNGIPFRGNKLTVFSCFRDRL
jgi:hypothetical protein